jgi:hypothetical protein
MSATVGDPVSVLHFVVFMNVLFLAQRSSCHRRDSPWWERAEGSTTHHLCAQSVNVQAAQPRCASTWPRKCSVRAERRCGVGNFVLRLAKAHSKTSWPPQARFCGCGSCTTMVGNGRARRQPADTTISIGGHTVMSASTSERHVAVAAQAFKRAGDSEQRTRQHNRHRAACGGHYRGAPLSKPGGIALRGVSFDSATQRRSPRSCPISSPTPRWS